MAFPSTMRAGDALALNIPGAGGFTQRVAIPEQAPPESFFQELRRTSDQASAWVPLQVSPYSSTLEQEPNGTPAKAAIATIPRVLHGAIATPDDRDAFAFDLTAGQRLVAHVECRPLGSPADLDISLIDPDGKTVNRVDTSPDGETRLEIQATRKGRHVLMVRSLTGEGGPEYVYRITIVSREPTVRLIADASGLAIPRGSHQPFALESHPDGFQRAGHAGASRGAVRNGPSRRAHPRGRGRDRSFDRGRGLRTRRALLGSSRGPHENRRRGACDPRHVTLPLIDRLPSGRGPHGEPFELREDQRRLPPTLTDRIAILVTPPVALHVRAPESASVVLPRYLDATFRLATTRVAGFDAPITFHFPRWHPGSLSIFRSPGSWPRFPPRPATG